MSAEQKKPVNNVKVGPDYRYIPQVYSARIITETREPNISAEDFGSDFLANAYMQGFARCCPDIVFW